MKRERARNKGNVKEHAAEITSNIEEQKERQFVHLVAEIIVDLTFKQAYEKGNTLPEVQQ